jgi:acetolactate synthase-1/2/3 large subunit
MPKLTGGEALIQSLVREGIRTVFGIPGLGQYEAIDALYLTPEIRYVPLRNEQSAIYMADGYARASGEIAATLLLPGPGVLTATGGMATAYAVSSPVLILTGSDHQREGFDDERDPPLLHALTKWAGRAQTVGDVPALVHTAMTELRSGRPRPVALEVSQEILAAREPVELVGQAAQADVDGVSEVELAQAVAWMADARRPLIIAGGGVHTAGASEALTALAEAWHAPVMTSRSGKGAVSDRHPLSVGYGELRFAPLRRLFEESDVVLAVGASMDLSRHPGKVIAVNIDPVHAPGDGHSTESGVSRLGLVGHARTVLHQLLGHAQQLGQRAGGEGEGDGEADPHALHAEIAALNRSRFAADQQLQPQADLMAAVRRALPDDAILATDMTQLGYYSRSYYPVYATRSYFTCSRLWTLGAALPLAMGAAVAQPHRAAVALIGDGGFLYHVQELATAVQHDIPVVIVLFNDNAFGNVLRAQEEEFDGHVLGTRLRNPDFMLLAQSFGVWARQVQSAPELEETLRQALALGKPALIEMPVGPMSRIY